MYWQKEWYRQAISMTLNNIYQLDLAKNGLLGTLLLYITGAQATGLGDTGGRMWIRDYITKVEIIADGSTVIKSLSASQLQAMAFLDQGVTMPDMKRMYATNEQRFVVPINFGRFMQDTDYGLDLSRYKSVEIRITNDAAAAQFTDLTVSLMSYWLRDTLPSQFKGCMYTEKWREWVPVAAGMQYLELPTDYLIRRVLLQPIPGFNGTTEEWYDTLNNLMYDIELSFNTGNDRVYKGTLYELMLQNYLEKGDYAMVTALTYLTADHASDIGLGYTLGMATGIASKDDAIATAIMTINADISSNLPKVENYEADTCLYMLGMGMAYEKMAGFHFDINLDPATWLSTKEKDTVKLDIQTHSTATVTSAKNNVIIDRMVR